MLLYVHEKNIHTVHTCPTPLSVAAASREAAEDSYSLAVQLYALGRRDPPSRLPGARPRPQLPSPSPSPSAGAGAGAGAGGDGEPFSPPGCWPGSEAHGWGYDMLSHTILAGKTEAPAGRGSGAACTPQQQARRALLQAVGGQRRRLVETLESLKVRER